eukprot:CAMPEP_0117510484 /NCGR_PEP_ID=MMETSP0784-20121206/28014_1 /TAXON_ID=39447 /ORGANISM="" /LENGTH=54 /DNA_ID=CAMNT_0005306123 /DNA_START=119 /DNA_END=279 /DNA_ORIENTATION=+
MWSLGVMMYILLTDEHPLSRDASELDTRRLQSLGVRSRFEKDGVINYAEWLSGT